MERWLSSRAVLTLVMTLHVHLVPFVNGSEEKEKLNHPTCLEDAHGMNTLVGENRDVNWTLIKNNTATSCKMHCKDLQYKFAGTKKTLCVCGDSIKIGTKVSKCEQKCLGDETEVCGGDNSISLYATGAIKTTTTKIARKTRSKTTPIVSSTPYQTTNASRDVLVTEYSTKNYFNSKTSTTVVSSVIANKHIEDAASTTITAVCISISSVIVIVGVIVVITCLIARRRRIKNESHVKYHGNPPTNECHSSDNGTTNNKLLENSNANDGIPNIDQSLQDTAQSRISNDNIDAEYSTVDPGNTIESNQQYGYFKTQQTDSTSTRGIYSHLQNAQGQGVPKVSPTENTYSHIGACKLLEQYKHSNDETDNTYNVHVLRSAQRTNDAKTMSNDNGDEDSVYDKAIVGGKLQVRNDNLNNEYAQLKTVNTKKSVQEQEQSTVNKETVVYKEVNTDTGFYEQVDEGDHQYFVLEPGK